MIRSPSFSDSFHERCSSSSNSSFIHKSYNKNYSRREAFETIWEEGNEDLSISINKDLAKINSEKRVSCQNLVSMRN